MQFDILTIFPHIFDSYFKEGIIKRAQAKKIIKILVHDIRKEARDKHKTVDDRPYGGGPGMILKVEPIFNTLKKIKKKKKAKVILFAPEGKLFNQKKARQLTKFRQLILICGRYEGFDARVKKLVDEEISIGSYVLTGGEIPALVLVDAVTRLLPRVLGNQNSTLEETFTVSPDYVEYPQYTRPAVFKPKKGTFWKVPPVLLSGHHRKIKEWRKKQVRKKSKKS